MTDLVHSGLTASITSENEVETVPERIQLKRTKGWRMPENTVKVDRSTRWGNPDKAEVFGAPLAVRLFKARFEPGGFGSGPIHAIITADVIRRELRGKNLACWCAVGDPCHADVLLEIANAPETAA